MPRISPDEIARIAAGCHHDPHSVLGAHPGPGGITVRVLRPLAATVTLVLSDGRRLPMRHVHRGVFEAILPPGEVPDYRFAITRSSSSDDGARAAGPEALAGDPYRYLPTLNAVDLHLIGEGRHEQLWKVLGAHVRRLTGTTVTGTSFAVWAPHARGVRIAADFNGWDGRGYPMRSLGSSGVWELFVPGVGAGTPYTYEICGPDGSWRAKADPMAQSAEPPPATASVVYASHYTWSDSGWLAARAERSQRREPMSIYEVHLGSWRPGLSYRELAAELTAYVTSMGFTHVELLPVAEHPYGGSWGYQVSSYYAPTARFGAPDDFRYLVDRLHQAGVGVFIDWVPAHFPRDDWALARFDGAALYEHADPRRGEQPRWGTLMFDYGRAEVRNFLVANAVYWLEEFHIDGLRVDAVSSMLYLDFSRNEGQWTPNVHGGRENLQAIVFLQEVNATACRRAPGITTIAEEPSVWPGVTRPVHRGGLGFGFKLNVGWMHDTLEYLTHDPVVRHAHHNDLTFSLVYAFTENFVLPLSHDEVVHGKGSLLGRMPGDEWQRFAGLRALFAYMWAHPGKKLLFMGSEFGQVAEWSEQNGLEWRMLTRDFHRGAQQLVRDLNRVYRTSPALWQQDSSPEGFSWIDADDAGGSTLSFLRFAQGAGLAGADPGAAVVACIANFSATPHRGYRVGLPWAGRWRELINTDATAYGGSGAGNLGMVEAVPEPWHGKPASASLTVPPLGVLWLAPGT